MTSLPRRRRITLPGGTRVTALLCTSGGGATGATTSLSCTAPGGTSLAGNSAEWVVEAPTIVQCEYVGTLP